MSYVNVLTEIEKILIKCWKTIKCYVIKLRSFWNVFPCYWSYLKRSLFLVQSLTCLTFVNIMWAGVHLTLKFYNTTSDFRTLYNFWYSLNKNNEIVKKEITLNQLNDFKTNMEIYAFDEVLWSIHFSALHSYTFLYTNYRFSAQKCLKTIDVQSKSFHFN